MMVESVDGSHALLGRSKRMRPGMMTCLSGFIEQVSWSRCIHFRYDHAMARSERVSLFPDSNPVSIQVLRLSKP